MKTCMPLDGFRWSCDSDSALCDILQTNVFGRTGGGKREIMYIFANENYTNKRFIDIKLFLL